MSIEFFTQSFLGFTGATFVIGITIIAYIVWVEKAEMGTLKFTKCVLPFVGVGVFTTSAILPNAIAVGTTIGGLLVMLFVFLCLLLWRHEKKRSAGKKTGNSSTRHKTS